MLNYATVKPGEKITFKKSQESSYSTLKRELDDSVLDVRQIGELDLWFDDEFLLKEDSPIPTVIIKNSRTANLTDYDIILCGNVVFASHDEEGNTVSLTKEALEIMNEFKPALLGSNVVYVYENY
ncbi:hypothetical protein [Geobacillus phage GR1]|nr:hypothetical protein [Geobacillus phage GR1]